MATTADVVNELTRTRDQRDRCALQVDGVRDHQGQAAARLARLGSAEDRPSSQRKP